MTTDIDDQQKVLSEVSHDLANCFHRSYYFLELIADALPEGNVTASTTLSRLRGTVEEIETMSRSAIEFVRPLELRTSRVRLSDLLGSLRQHLGVRTLEIGGDGEAGDSEVDVDPGRISQALGLLCKAAIGDDASAAPLAVELLSGEAVGLRMHRLGAAPAKKSDLSLALISRIARLHGGELVTEDGDEPSLTLRLPVANPESR